MFSSLLNGTWGAYSFTWILLSLFYGKSYTLKAPDPPQQVGLLTAEQLTDEVFESLLQKTDRPFHPYSWKLIQTINVSKSPRTIIIQKFTT